MRDCWRRRRPGASAAAWTASEDDVDREPVREWIRSGQAANGLFRRFGDVRLGREGRSLFMRCTRPAEDLFTG